MMHVTIGAVNAFTDKCVVGVTANREKAEGWLAKNAILVTALNPIIGYQKGAEVAKRAMAENRSRSEEHTSELQSRPHLVCRLLLEKKKEKKSVPRSACSVHKA